MRKPVDLKNLDKLRIIEPGTEHIEMNNDIFEGKWKVMHGQMKEWWGKITDDDLEQAGGNATQIVGLLQQRYGFSRRRAEVEFNRRVNEIKVKIEKI